MVSKRITTVNDPSDTFSVEFGERLREERERRASNQADFGALGGVAKITQLNYEKGYRVPDAQYLSNLRKHGVDVDYLLSGQRNMPAGGRLDAKLLSLAMTAVHQGLKERGHMFSSGAEGAALILAVYDELLCMSGSGLTVEQIASSILKGWCIGRSRGG